MIVNYAINVKYCLEDCKVIVTEVNAYIDGKIPFDSKVSDTRKYWDAIPSNILLKSVSIRIINILPHSTAFERFFSRMTHVKNKWQNRMAEDTLSNMMKVKMFFLGGREEDTKHIEGVHCN